MLVYFLRFLALQRTPKKYGMEGFEPNSLYLLGALCINKERPKGLSEWDLNPEKPVVKPLSETGKKVKHSGIFEKGRFRSYRSIAFVEYSIIILKIAESS